MKICFLLCIVSLACNKINHEVISHKNKYGGIFRMATPQYVNNFYPPEMNSQGDFLIGHQIYEGLVKINKKDLGILPSLAYNWIKSPNGLTYTFMLRQDVYFQNDPCFSDSIGRKLNAYDVEYSFYQICTYAPNNVGFTQVFKDRVLGANSYYEASKNGRPSFRIEGFKVLDQFTIQIQLAKPFTPFLYFLAKPNAFIFPYEAIIKYGKNMTNNAVGTGPFILSSIGVDQIISLIRNPRYWKRDEDENQLPYLEQIDISFIDNENSEFHSFKNGNLDIIPNVPKDFYDDVFTEQGELSTQFNKYVLYKNPICLSVYYQIITTQKPFNDKRVRQAFNYAIDKNLMIEYIIGNSNYIGATHGIVPPTFKNYNIKKVKGYEYNPDLAEQLLAEAGFPNGQGFPVVKLMAVQRGLPIAEALKKMLEDVLNIKVELTLAPTFKDKIENSKMGLSHIYQAAWYADYPNPENFLYLFYGKNVPQKLDEPSYPNVTRFKNPVFDSLYNRAITAKDESDCFRFLMEAENVLMDEAPLIVLYYPVYNTLINPKIQNLSINPLYLIDLSDVYLEKEEM